MNHFLANVILKLTNPKIPKQYLALKLHFYNPLGQSLKLRVCVTVVERLIIQSDKGKTCQGCSSLFIYLLISSSIH